MRLRIDMTVLFCLVVAGIGAPTAGFAAGCQDYTVFPRHLAAALTDGDESLVAVGDALVTIRSRHILQGWSGAGTDLPQVGEALSPGDGATYSALAGHGDRLFATAGEFGVRIFTLDGTRPVLVDSLLQSRSASGLAIVGGRLVVNRNADTLLIFDLAAPHPALIDSLALPASSAPTLRGARGLVLVVTGSPTVLHFVDLVAPAILSSVVPPWDVGDVSWDGQFALIRELNGVEQRLVDARDPVFPVVVSVPEPAGNYNVGGTVVDGVLWLTGCDYEVGGIVARYQLAGSADPEYLGHQPWIGAIREAIAVNGRLHQLTEQIFYDPVPCTMAGETLATATLGEPVPAPERLVFYDGVGGGGPMRTAITGDLYCYLDSARLKLVDLSDPAAPQLRGTVTYDIMSLSLHLMTSGMFVIVGGRVAVGDLDERGRLLVYDVSNPDAPVRRDTEICQRFSFSACANDRVYTWGVDGILRTYTLATAGYLLPESMVDLPGQGGVADMLALGDLLFVIDDSMDLAVWNFADPHSPVPWDLVPSHLVYDHYWLRPWPDGVLWFGRYAAEQYAYEAMVLGPEGESTVRKLWTQMSDTDAGWYDGIGGDGNQLVLAGEYGDLVLDVTGEPTQIAGVVPVAGFVTLFDGHLVGHGYDGLEVWAPSCQTVTAAPGLPPRALTRLDAWPNPFNPNVTVRFDLARPADARLAVYDLQGRRRRVLLDGQLANGPHAATWDGRDGAGRALASGVYLVRLETPDRTAAVKVTLLE